MAITEPGQPTPPVPPSGPPAPPTRTGPSMWLIASIIGGLVLVGGGLGAFFALRGDGGNGPTPGPPGPSPTISAKPTESIGPTAELSDVLQQRVGNFRLVGTQPDPDAIANLGANDALIAQYRRADGVQIEHRLMVFDDHFAANSALNALTDAVEAQGYFTVSTDRTGGITVNRLAGQNEIVVWSDGPLVATAEGPFDVTTGFYLLVPY